MNCKIIKGHCESCLKESEMRRRSSAFKDRCKARPKEFEMGNNDFKDCCKASP